MRSKIYNISEEEMEKWLLTHNDMDELFSFIGFRRAGGNFKTLFKYILENNLSDVFKDFRKRVIENGHKKTASKLTKSFEKMFCKNSSSTRNSLKKVIIKNNLFEYKCAICGNIGEWNGQRLVLQLDHINGIWNDNRLENLRFLCPNCHSQTETFCGGNLKKEETKKVSQKEKLRQKRWKLIQQSNIDFTKFGWVKEISKIFGIAENKAGKYIRNNFPEFYKTCFVRT